MAKERAKGQRIRGTDRERLKATLAKQYAAGSTIRALAAEHHVSIGLSRNLLVEAGVQFRSRGGSRGKRTART